MRQLATSVATVASAASVMAPLAIDESFMPAIASAPNVVDRWCRRMSSAPSVESMSSIQPIDTATAWRGSRMPNIAAIAAAAAPPPARPSTPLTIAPVGVTAPKKIALGERAIMVDGAGYLIIQYKEKGDPVDIVYPEEGTPLATSPSVLFKGAPNPNAGRLFQNWMHSREAQQILVDFARQYSPHSQTVEKPGVRRLADIKLMKEDPEAIEKNAEDIKKRYSALFKV